MMTLRHFEYTRMIPSCPYHHEEVTGVSSGSPKTRIKHFTVLMDKVTSCKTSIHLSQPLMAEVLLVSPTCKRVTCSELPGWKHGTPSTRALRILALGTWQLMDGNWLKHIIPLLSLVWYMQEYWSFVRFNKNTETKWPFGFQIFVFCLTPCDSESLHNSKFCFAGFGHGFLSQPLVREDLSTTYLTTMFQIDTTEWYCNRFKLCNKLFCLDSSQVGRTLSYNWNFIQCTASMTSKCFLCSLVNIWGVTPDGAMTPGCHCLEFDSWWFLRKQLGFLVCCWFQETSRNKMWRVVMIVVALVAIYEYIE